MDPQAKKKLFRAKLNAQKQEKQRIDSPLVRYNEHDQPVCKVCEVVIKSEALWQAHLNSRKHNEAVENLKARAAGLNQPNKSKPEPPKDLPKHKSEAFEELHDKSVTSTAVPKVKSSMLPPNFFDSQENKRQKKETDSVTFRESISHSKDSVSAKPQVLEPFVPENESDGSSTANFERDPEFQASKNFRQVSKDNVDLETKQAKGALPKGFFDDNDADLRARGIKPVKPNVKDEYKEFEKLIKEDLEEVDNRLEEDEVDTADMIQEEESVEQSTYRERVELLRKKKLEVKASKSAVRGKDTEVTQKESDQETSLSDDESDDNFVVDWRAKRF